MFRSAQHDVMDGCTRDRPRAVFHPTQNSFLGLWQISALLLAIPAFVAQGARAQEPAARYEASHDAMGTVFTIVAYGPDARFLAQVANDAFDEIDSLDSQMSNYKVESELSRINRNAAREPVLVEPRLLDLIAESIRYSQESNGAFDVTVGPLMKVWGFFRGEGRVPPRSELARAMKSVGSRHIRLDREQRTIGFDANGLELDLGGIAKGYAVDRAVDILRGNGVTQALVSAGTSSVFALGAPPSERAWRITLRDPYDQEKVGNVVRLKDYSLSVSGSYEKSFKLNGKTYAHILDPRSGRPVQGMLMTTVLAPRAVESDALSTIFFVMGAHGSRTYLSRHPNLAALFYAPTSGRHGFRRAYLRSAVFNSPPESVAEFER